MVSISVSRTGTFLGLGVSQGGTPKDPEKTGWVGLDFYRRKDGVPPRGPRDVGVGLTFLGLGVS
jgi:hypothetical protein